MNERYQAVDLIHFQLIVITDKRKNEKHNKHHYGLIELRQLLDFIYDQKPQNEKEIIKNINNNTKW